MFKTHSATSIIPNEAFTSALGVLLLFIASWLMGCRAERFYNEKNTLAFSQDTVWFDTVFTRKPGSTYPISVTKIVSIKNQFHTSWRRAIPVSCFHRRGIGH
jgi:hypothetical protein